IDDLRQRGTRHRPPAGDLVAAAVAGDREQPGRERRPRRVEPCQRAERRKKRVLADALVVDIPQRQVAHQRQQRALVALHEQPEKPHVVRQHFGWRETRLAGRERAGEVGGWVQRSITPAFYAKKIERRTFEEALSASGTFAVTNGGGASGALVGWFNEKSKG